MSSVIRLCAGTTAALAPIDAKAAAALAKAGSKVRKLIAAKCDDATVGALALCASAGNGLADRLIAAHHQGIVEAVVAQYGDLPPTADPSARRCQGAIGKSAAGYLNAYLKASQKCLNARNSDDTPGCGAARCIGAMSGGFVPPNDDKVAAALQKASAKLASAPAWSAPSAPSPSGC